MKMTIPYNVTSKARKRLVEDVSTALNTIPRYLGTPTMSYQIGDCLLDRKGTLTIPDTADGHTAQTLLAYLAEHGYEGKAEKTADRLTISIPRDTLDDTQLAVLRQIIASREPLLKRAFLAENLCIEATDDQIGFPWFGFTQDVDEVNAYTEFVAKLCDIAQRQKRVMPTTADTDNDKYTFRCFLLRLCFIGSEYKAARKVLLKNLPGKYSRISSSKEMLSVAAEVTPISAPSSV